jgi:hypothetical protein
MASPRRPWNVADRRESPLTDQETRALLAPVPPRVVLVLLLLACRPAADSTPPDRHVIPLGLVHVALRGIDEAPAERLSLDAAADLYNVTETEYEATYRNPGHRRWFFHAFDRDTLVFLVALWQPRELGGTYTVVRRIVVRRTRRAALVLDVARRIAEYEHGTGDLRAGMTPEEVERRRGPPERVEELGPVGSFDYIYSDLCARFLSGKVAHLWPRESCVRP